MSRKINYKSDFDFTSKLIDPAGKVIPFPEYDWSARFHTSLRTVCYVASCRDGVYTNCFRESDGSIHFVFDKHGLGTGQLRCEFRFDNPNPIYTSAIQRLFDPQNIDIELIDGRSDSASPAEIQSMYPYIKGEPFTYEDFTAEQLTEIKRPAVEAAAEVTEAANKATEAAQAADAAAQKAESLNDTASEAESLRTEAEQERRIAEAARAEEFAAWQGEIDSKADRSELSNVLAEEPLTPEIFPDINTYTREELKMDLFIDMWNDAWGKYGGYDPVNAPDAQHPFMGNEIWMTYEEAITVMQLYTARGINLNSVCDGTNAKTFVPFRGLNGGMSMNCFCAHSPALEIVVLRSVMTAVNDMYAAFYYCPRLREIKGAIAPPHANLDRAFFMCGQLEEVRIYRLEKSIDFRYSSKLSLASLSYMVGGASNAKAITITVHPDVYAKLTDESNAEWHQVLIDAAEKNITFATV